MAKVLAQVWAHPADQIFLRILTQSSDEKKVPQGFIGIILGTSPNQSSDNEVLTPQEQSEWEENTNKRTSRPTQKAAPFVSVPAAYYYVHMLARSEISYDMLVSYVCRTTAGSYCCCMYYMLFCPLLCVRYAITSGR